MKTFLPSNYSFLICIIVLDFMESGQAEPNSTKGSRLSRDKT